MGCVKLSILDEQYKSTETKESSYKKELTFNFYAINVRKETQLIYYGARYYDPSKGIYNSRDKYFEKVPYFSPYAQCFNNPVKYVDPDGNFPIPMHYDMVQIALSRTIITPEAAHKIAYGASTRADMSGAKSLHLDNMNGYSEIGAAYLGAKNNYSINIKRGNYEQAGEALHTIGDFYSHSNFIPLYQQYATGNGLSMDINDIPTLSDVINNPDLAGFRDVLGKELKTGTFGEGNVVKEYVKDKFSNDKNSHGQMNLDSNRSPAGKKAYNNKNTMHEAARATAQKDLNRTVNNGQD